MTRNMKRIASAAFAALAFSAVSLAADFDVCAYGASTAASPAANAKAINAAIAAASASGSGRVVVPQGLFVTGTVRMQSNVELYLAEGAVLKRASRVRP